MDKLINKNLVTHPWALHSLRPVTHVCISNVTIINSDSGLSAGGHQAII